MKKEGKFTTDKATMNRATGKAMTDSAMPSKVAGKGKTDWPHQQKGSYVKGPKNPKM